MWLEVFGVQLLASTGCTIQRLRICLRDCRGGAPVVGGLRSRPASLLNKVSLGFMSGMCNCNCTACLRLNERGQAENRSVTVRERCRSANSPTKKCAISPLRELPDAPPSQVCWRNSYGPQRFQRRHYQPTRQRSTHADYKLMTDVLTCMCT